MALLRALPTPDQYQITGEGRYDSAFAVTDLANASVGAVGVALADLVAALNLAPQPARGDRRPAAGVPVVQIQFSRGGVGGSRSLGSDRRELSDPRRLDPAAHQPAPPPRCGAVGFGLCGQSRGRDCRPF